MSSSLYGRKQKGPHGAPGGQRGTAMNPFGFGTLATGSVEAPSPVSASGSFLRGGSGGSGFHDTPGGRYSSFGRVGRGNWGRGLGGGTGNKFMLRGGGGAMPYAVNSAAGPRPMASGRAWGSVSRGRGAPRFRRDREDRDHDRSNSPERDIGREWESRGGRDRDDSLQRRDWDAERDRDSLSGTGRRVSNFDRTGDSFVREARMARDRSGHDRAGRSRDRDDDSRVRAQGRNEQAVLKDSAGTDDKEDLWRPRSRRGSPYSFSQPSSTRHEAGRSLESNGPVNDHEDDSSLSSGRGGRANVGMDERNSLWNGVRGPGNNSGPSNKQRPPQVLYGDLARSPREERRSHSSYTEREDEAAGSLSDGDRRRAVKSHSTRPEHGVRSEGLEGSSEGASVGLRAGAGLQQPQQEPRAPSPTPGVGRVKDDVRELGGGYGMSTQRPVDDDSPRDDMDSPPPLEERHNEKLNVVRDHSAGKPRPVDPRLDILRPVSLDSGVQLRAGPAASITHPHSPVKPVKSLSVDTVATQRHASSVLAAEEVLGGANATDLVVGVCRGLIAGRPMDGGWGTRRAPWTLPAVRPVQTALNANASVMPALSLVSNQSGKKSPAPTVSSEENLSRSSGDQGDTGVSVVTKVAASAGLGEDPPVVAPAPSKVVSTSPLKPAADSDTTQPAVQPPPSMPPLSQAAAPTLTRSASDPRTQSSASESANAGHSCAAGGSTVTIVSTPTPNAGRTRLGWGQGLARRASTVNEATSRAAAAAHPLPLSTSISDPPTDVKADQQPTPVKVDVPSGPVKPDAQQAHDDVPVPVASPAAALSQPAAVAEDPVAEEVPAVETDKTETLQKAIEDEAQATEAVALPPSTDAAAPAEMPPTPELQTAPMEVEETVSVDVSAAEAAPIEQAPPRQRRVGTGAGLGRLQRLVWALVKSARYDAASRTSRQAPISGAARKKPNKAVARARPRPEVEEGSQRVHTPQVEQVEPPAKRHRTASVLVDEGHQIHPVLEPLAVQMVVPPAYEPPPLIPPAAMETEAVEVGMQRRVGEDTGVRQEEVRVELRAQAQQHDQGAPAPTRVPRHPQSSPPPGGTLFAEPGVGRRAVRASELVRTFVGRSDVLGRHSPPPPGVRRHFIACDPNVPPPSPTSSFKLPCSYEIERALRTLQSQLRKVRKEQREAESEVFATFGDAPTPYYTPRWEDAHAVAKQVNEEARAIGARTAAAYSAAHPPDLAAASDALTSATAKATAPRGWLFGSTLNVDAASARKRACIQRFIWSRKARVREYSEVMARQYVHAREAWKRDRRGEAEGSDDDDSLGPVPLRRRMALAGVTMGIRSRSMTFERISRSAVARGEYAGSDIDVNQIAKEMVEREKMRKRIEQGACKVVDMVLAVQREGTFEFVDAGNARLTTDGAPMRCAGDDLTAECPQDCNCPRAVEAQRRYVKPWSDLEKCLFVDKFLQFPKQFRKIAGFFKDKTTQDVVRFYYESSPYINYKALVKEADARRRCGEGEGPTKWLKHTAQQIGALVEEAPDGRLIALYTPTSDHAFSSFNLHPGGEPYSRTVDDMVAAAPLGRSLSGSLSYINDISEPSTPLEREVSGSADRVPEVWPGEGEVTLQSSSFRSFAGPPVAAMDVDAPIPQPPRRPQLLSRPQMVRDDREPMPQPPVAGTILRSVSASIPALPGDPGSMLMEHNAGSAFLPPIIPTMRPADIGAFKPQRKDVLSTFQSLEYANEALELAADEALDAEEPPSPRDVSAAIGRSRATVDEGGGESRARMSKWSEEEKRRAIQLLERHGKAWALIEKEMGYTKKMEQIKTFCQNYRRKQKLEEKAAGERVRKHRHRRTASGGDEGGLSDSMMHVRREPLNAERVSGMAFTGGPLPSFAHATHGRVAPPSPYLVQPPPLPPPLPQQHHQHHQPHHAVGPPPVMGLPPPPPPPVATGPSSKLQSLAVVALANLARASSPRANMNYALEPPFPAPTGPSAFPTRAFTGPNISTALPANGAPSPTAAYSTDLPYASFPFPPSMRSGAYQSHTPRNMRLPFAAPPLPPEPPVRMGGDHEPEHVMLPGVPLGPPPLGPPPPVGVMRVPAPTRPLVPDWSQQGRYGLDLSNGFDNPPHPPHHHHHHQQHHHHHHHPPAGALPHFHVKPAAMPYGTLPDRPPSREGSYKGSAEYHGHMLKDDVE